MEGLKVNNKIFIWYDVFSIYKYIKYLLKYSVLPVSEVTEFPKFRLGSYESFLAIKNLSDFWLVSWNSLLLPERLKDTSNIMFNANHIVCNAILGKQPVSDY